MRVEDLGFEELKNQVVSYIRAAYKEQNFTFKVLPPCQQAVSGPLR